MWAGIFFGLVFGFVHSQLRLDPLVNTPLGLIRGLRASDGDYSMFLGIPYATVNEDNPFGNSIPRPPFEGIFEANEDSAVCPQIEEFNNTIVGQLDCLHLNIYVPSKASVRNTLPVLVWVHGGGFAYGFSNRYLFGPKYLVQHDVILVTINYRLGPYGFMCLDTPDVPGNQGLKDQVLAMRWVKDNIQAFGGDKNKITAMGQSAGASSIEYHMYSNYEKLFDQAILQSGSVFSAWSIDESDVSAPLNIASRLGFETDKVTEALDFLKNTDTRLVIAASSELGLVFRVCVEKELDGVDSFLNDYPVNLNLNKVTNMPILSGFNSREQLITYANKPASYFRNLSVFENSMASAFNSDGEFDEMVDIVRHFYIGDEETSEEVKWSITDFSSDINFNYPVQRSLRNFFERGAQRVYQYVFSYSGNRNFVKKKLNITDDGATHGDENGYLFDFYDKTTPSDDDQKTIDRITTLWTNFVKHGDPTPETTELLPAKWTPMTEATYNYLDIDRELTLKRRPYHARMAFWELFYVANEEREKGYRIHKN